MSRRTYLLAAAVAAGAAAASYLLLVRWGPGFRFDGDTTRWILRADLERDGETVRRLGGAFATVLLGAVLLAYAHRFRGRRVTASAAVVLLGANATTQVLKPLLATSRDRPYFEDQFPHDTFPSGHATGAMAVALVALLVAPHSRTRVVAAVGLTYALLVGAAAILSADHFPSDVLGGFAVAAAWAALGAAALARPGAITTPR